MSAFINVSNVFSTDGLVITVGSESFDANVGEAITLGRAAAVVIGLDDPAMHRVVCSIWSGSAAWWITNRARVADLHIIGPGAESSIRCGPGATAALTLGDHEISVQPGQVNHTFRAACAPIGETGSENVDGGSGTISWGDISLGPVERRVLVAFAEPWLLDPTYNGRVPTNKSVQRRLGLSANSLNHALDRVSKKMDAIGIDGVVGGQGDLAVQRRDRLVSHALSFDLVRFADLELLESTAD